MIVLDPIHYVHIIAPVVITPSSPSHSLIKKTDEPSQEIDDEVSMRPDDATRRSIRFVSESTSVDPNNSNEQMEVDEQSNHDEQSGKMTIMLVSKVANNN